jgi:hypothetical protein
MTASAGPSAKTPSAASEVVIIAVAVLLYNNAVTTRESVRDLFDQRSDQS